MALWFVCVAGNLIVPYSNSQRRLYFQRMTVTISRTFEFSLLLNYVPNRLFVT